MHDCINVEYVYKNDWRLPFFKKITQKIIDKVTNVLESEVKTYDQYLTGDVYGYEIYEVSECDKGCEHKEFVDSCWGFYGEDECMTEAKGVVEYRLENKKEIV